MTTTATAARTADMSSGRAPAVLLVVVVVLGFARWNGVPPFGSDNDEYRLVAQQLLRFDAPVVAGVEGTKYPLGYPALLAVLDGVGLPVVDTALVLNVALVGVAAALAGLAVRRLGAAAVVVATGVVLLARPLWDATQSTMPDVAFTAAVIGAAVVAGARIDDRRRLVALTVLALVATALKSVGVLVGVAAAAALLWRQRGAERTGGAKERIVLPLVPAAAALVLSAVTALVVRRYPEHTTGYARTFWLDDPYDAAGGDASVGDVVNRIPRRMDLVLDDAARALWRELVHGPPAWMLTLALVGAGIAAARAGAQRIFVAAFVVLDLVALAVWPYLSVRFGLPLVPIAAMGAGYLASRVPVAPWVGVAVVATTTVALVALAVPALQDDAEREAAVFADMDAARRDVAAWLPEDARPVSPDYRELATVLPRDRAVLPMSYTTDTDALLAEAQRGTHLVILQGLYGSREALVASLLAAHGDRFRMVHDTPHADIYEVIG